MAHDVFISYATPNKPIADAVCARLEQAGIRCWIAPRDVGPGNYPTSIVNGIEACKALVVIVSAGANLSPNVSREVLQGINRSKIIVPIRIEDVKPAGDLEFLLGIVHWMDAITPPLESHIQTLVDELNKLMGRGAAGPPQSHGVPRAGTAKLILPAQYASLPDPIYVAGSFNNWLDATNGKITEDRETLSRYKLGRSGDGGSPVRAVKLALPRGNYEFKFVTGDGRWLPWVEAAAHPPGESVYGGANFRISVT